MTSSKASNPFSFIDWQHPQIKIFFSEIEKAAGHVLLVGPMKSPIPAREWGDSPILAVDGGASRLTHDKMNALLKKGLWIGDGDSSEDPSGMHISIPAAKDFSDLAFALTILQKVPARAQNPSLHIHSFGFLGGRKDHELINLGEIHHFLLSIQLPQPTRFSLDDHFLALSAGTHDIDLGAEERAFSLLSLAAENTIELSPVSKNGHDQVAYPLSPAAKIKMLSSHTLSNSGQGKIQLKNTAPLFIYFVQ